MKKSFVKNFRSIILVSFLVYILFVSLYFLPINISFKIAFPLISLFLFSLFIQKPFMILAMLFSAIGDFMASYDFIGQMSSFALAHIFFILYFVKLLRIKQYKFDIQSTRTIFSICLFLSIFIFAFYFIIFSIPRSFVQYSVGLYIILLLSMLFSALQQKEPLFTYGAILFVLSDAILAWNKFVSPITSYSLFIMIPYYLAQYSLFLCAAKQNKTV